MPKQPDPRRPSMMARKLAEEIVRQKLARLAVLRRDVSIIAIKQKELDEKWRQILMKSKCDGKDIEVAWQAFTRAYDRKDGIINHIFKLMEIADRQYALHNNQFINIVDNTIQMFLYNIEKLEKINERNTAEVLKKGSDEYNKLEASFKENQTQLHIISHYAKMRLEEVDFAVRGDRVVKLEHESEQCESSLETLISFLENNFRDMWEGYKSVLRNYVRNTSDLQKKSRTLRKRVNFLDNLIQEQSSKTQQCETSLQYLQTELDNFYENSSLCDLIKRRDDFRAAWRNVTKKLSDEKERDRQNIELLVYESNKAGERILKSETICHKIISMIALCRKYETLNEKVLPIALTDRSKSEKKISVHVALRRLVHKSQSLVSTGGINSAIAATFDYKSLYYRIGKARLLCNALRREKKILLEENEMICSYLSNNDESTTASNSASLLGESTLTIKSALTSHHKPKTKRILFKS